MTKAIGEPVNPTHDEDEHTKGKLLQNLPT